MPLPTPPIDPGQAILKKVVSELGKSTSAHAVQAVQEGVPLPHVLEQLLLMTGGGARGGAGPPGSGGPQPPMGKKPEEAIAQDPNATATEAATAQSTAQPTDQGSAMQVVDQLIQQSQGAPAQPPSKPGLHQGFGIDAKTGKVTPESILFGLIQQHPDNVKTMVETAILGQKFAGKEPLQEGERKKIQQQELVDIYKAQIAKAGTVTDVDKMKMASTMFETDMSNLVDAFDAMTTGPILGGATSVLAGTLGKVTGFGRGTRGELDSMSKALAFSVGQYVFAQTGRGLSDRDVKQAEALAKFAPSMTGSEFKGRVGALIKFANSRMAASGVGTPLPTNVDVFIERIRNQRSTRKALSGARLVNVQQVSQ